jgi:hypothetical protein
MKTIRLKNVITRIDLLLTTSNDGPLPPGNGNSHGDWQIGEIKHVHSDGVYRTHLKRTGLSLRNGEANMEFGISCNK